MSEKLYNDGGVREASFILYTQENTKPDFWEYLMSKRLTNQLRAICICNHIFEIFTVHEVTIGFFKRKTKFLIECPMINSRTGRSLGRAYFDTLEEAIELSKKQVDLYFPKTEEITN